MQATEVTVTITAMNVLVFVIVLVSDILNYCDCEKFRTKFPDLLFFAQASIIGSHTSYLWYDFVSTKCVKKTGTQKFKKSCPAD